MSNRPRFIIEGTWSGFLINRQQLVHRTVHNGNMKKLRAWAERTHGIQFPDRTMLYLGVRSCNPRERVEEIKGYVDLISSCSIYDVNSVNALRDKLKEIRAQKKALQEEKLDGDGRRG